MIRQVCIRMARHLATISVLTLLALPVAAQRTAITPLAREKAWAQWQQASADLGRWERLRALPSPVQEALFSEAQGLEPALVEAGVLAHSHAWPAGCAPVQEILDGALAHAQTPLGMEAWRDWRAVYQVTCGPAGPDLQEDVQALTQALERVRTTTLKDWTLPSHVDAWFLGALPDAVWRCMRDQVPEALRSGLDRHEGLAFVARQCAVDPEEVFGEAVRCLDCAGHPQVPQRRLRQAWAWVP